MTRKAFALAAMLTMIPALAWRSSAQDTAGGFPLDKTFQVVSVGDLNVQQLGITLSVVRDPRANGFRGSGSAGCNRWTGGVVLRDGEFRPGQIATTKMYCDSRMSSEDAFLAALNSARRWRLEGERLIIEGEGARLLLTQAAEVKPQR
jgi:hypothetical protein